MKLREGDKVLCKANFTWYFRKGSYYTINKIWLDTGKWHKKNHGCYWVEFEEFEFHFSTIKIKNLNYFNDYFETIKDTRKRKLDKLMKKLDEEIF
jgi:hypothetical protein